MEPDKLPDKPQEAELATPAEGAGNPLSEKKVTAARYSRLAAKIVWGVIALVLGFSMIRACVPQKKLSAQEAATVQAARNVASGSTRPNLPANIEAAAGKYSDLRPGVAGAQPSPTDGAGGAPQAAGSADPGGGQGEGQPAQEQGTFLNIGDQRRKDSVSARRAPVSFGGQDVTPQDRAQVKEPSPDLPELSGLTRVVDRLSSGAQGIAPADADDQNRQGEKREFTREDRDDFPYLKTTLLTPISRYEVKAGSIIPGILLTGINSDLPGQITAQVRENVYDTVSGRFLLIPQGTRLIGEYDAKISYGQERVLVVWTRIIMPNGNSIGLEGMPGVDLSGYAGISGRVNNHYGKLVAGVVLGSVIGAGAQAAVGGQGSANVPPTFPQLFVSGAAGNINQAGQQITQKNLNLQPTLEISPGQKINIFLTKDMILKPYTD